MEELLRLNDIKEEKVKEIINLRSSFRKSTLRNKNRNIKYATEEEIKIAENELCKIERKNKRII